METLLTFVLGALSGLFLIGMVYVFAEVLKMRQTIKGLLEAKIATASKLRELENLSHKLNENLKRDFFDAISDLRRDMDNRYEETDRIMGLNNSDVHGRIDEVSRYIDSRIDKSVTVLCNRMDVMFERKPDFENTPKSQEVLLKS